MEFPYLFNFSTARYGGGLKRLHAFARWFDAHGGAAFVIHEDCSDLLEKFPANRYFCVAPSMLGRLIDDWSYLDPIRAELGIPELYYAYNIPVYRCVGQVNWFHLSNVCPFNLGRVPMPAIDYLKQPILAWRYQRNLTHADIISAESRASLSCFCVADTSRLFVSVNGGDDELARASMPPVAVPDDTAVVVGTYKYKAIDDSYRVFLRLKSENPSLRMIVIGVPEQAPKAVRRAPDLTWTGVLPRADVLERAKFYISTTRLENSYNAASEGVFLARESFISDIPPHRELLGAGPREMVSIPGVRTQLMHSRREDLSTGILKTWNQVVTEMLDRAGLPANRVAARSASPHRRPLWPTASGARLPEQVSNHFPTCPSIGHSDPHAVAPFVSRSFWGSYAPRRR